LPRACYALPNRVKPPSLAVLSLGAAPVNRNSASPLPDRSPALVEHFGLTQFLTHKLLKWALTFVLDTDVVSHLRPTGESEPQRRGAGCQCALGEYLRLITLLELELGACCWNAALLDGATKNASANPTLSVIYSG
jgi:hypothetical protein